jgi:2-polyprenyl-3-methyl-5-hydroxy-6-metoxy-1,4-benzoquinol methylase
MNEHDNALSRAFDGQAARFEVAPVQSDPAALARLVEFADLPPESSILDAGCGPGLVAEAFLSAGHSVHGLDLSPEMIARAERRCARFGARATFANASLYEHHASNPYDATVSRYVLHHVADALAFVRHQVNLLRPGGILILSDHATDADPEIAAHHERLERGRDSTHTRNLRSGELVDLLAAAGLRIIRLAEEEFHLDFDEWFDRGTPVVSKAELRDAILNGPSVRGFRAEQRSDGSVRIDCVRALVRGVKP